MRSSPRIHARSAIACTLAVLATTAGALAMEPDGGPAPDDGSSMAQVLVTYQEHDPFLPWQTQTPGTRDGYAVAVGAGRFVTTEHLVRNHRLVEIRPARSGKKYPASVRIADPELNLALLEVGSDAQTAFTPLSIATVFPGETALRLIQFDDARNPQAGDGRVVQVDMAALPHAPYPSLTFSLLTDLNVNGEGAPALHNGMLAGLIMAYDRQTRIGAMVPYPVLRRFLDDTASEPYQGAPTAGFIWKPLIDPVRRRHLNVESDNGVLVLSCLPETGARHTLLPDDVILEWDGYAIDSLGTYTDPDFGRLAFSYLIKGRRQSADEVSASIVRNGAVTNVTVRLSVFRDGSAYIPENVTGEPEPYLVQGGFVLREVSGRYLTSRGSGWERYTDTRIAHLYLTRRYAPPEPGARLVVLATVFPDPINVGYPDLRDALVESVNGESIRNLDDVFRIADRDGAITRVRLRSFDVDLVLDREALPAADARISSAYRIPRLRSTPAE